MTIWLTDGDCLNDIHKIEKDGNWHFFRYISNEYQIYSIRIKCEKEKSDFWKKMELLTPIRANCLGLI
jgi:hypothetical protein